MFIVELVVLIPPTNARAQSWWLSILVQNLRCIAQVPDLLHSKKPEYALSIFSLRKPMCLHFLNLLKSSSVNWKFLFAFLHYSTHFIEYYHKDVKALTKIRTRCMQLNGFSCWKRWNIVTCKWPRTKFNFEEPTSEILYSIEVKTWQSIVWKQIAQKAQNYWVR